MKYATAVEALAAVRERLASDNTDDDGTAVYAIRRAALMADSGAYQEQANTWCRIAEMRHKILVQTRCELGIQVNHVV